MHLLLAALLARPFGHGEATHHVTATAPYTFENTIVRLSFDLSKHTVIGDETAIVRPKANGLAILPFHSLGISYMDITVNGTPVTDDVDEAHQTIGVHLPAPATAGQRLVVEFHYEARPQRGIYFVLPDSGYPHITPEIWSQGQPEDNRRWFPTWDEPNQKTPSELIITVPKGWTVVANGSLKSHVIGRASETWDWRSAIPKATYLIAFAAGPLAEHHTSLGTLNVDSYVPPAFANVNATCFGDTKDIVAFFARRTGVRFPWEKEDQIAAERFIYGGMENASATIQTALALHPPSEEPESSCDSLVSHELAQQWFGDDPTMADWANAWLHEGFATYFQELWSGEQLGEAEFEYERYQAQQTYFAETTQYYRPIVDADYGDPIDVFDSSSHERPGEILHSLRWMFGDARFFKALHDYLVQYHLKNADTHQFFVAIGKSLGTNLDWFENEWFYRASYPDYHVSDRYDAGTHTLTIYIRQANHNGDIYRMPVAIEAWNGSTVRRIEPTIERVSQTVAIANVPSKPDMVLFDPNNNLLRKLTFAKSLAELAYQLRHAAHVGDREWALAQVAGSKGAAAAVRDVVLHDPFYGVRADATTVAVGFDDGGAIDGALHDSDKRVILAAEAGAAQLRHPPAAVVADLSRLAANSDPNVAAAALQTLGGLHAPHIYERLVRSLSLPSFYDAIAVGALQGLAAYGDARALPLIRARTAYGTEDVERDTAIGALAQLAASLRRPQAALPELLQIVAHDPLVSSRVAAANALGALGDPAAIPTLEAVEHNDSQTIVQITAWGDILTIRDAVAKRR